MGSHRRDAGRVEENLDYRMPVSHPVSLPYFSEGATRQPVDPRHRHHVARRQLAEHPVKLASVRSRAGHLLAVDVPAAASGRRGVQRNWLSGQLRAYEGLVFRMAASEGQLFSRRPHVAELSYFGGNGN